MPSMWKKQKGSRISRLVSDLQTTPKRGGSLVVETGFPTSIADLFVKNHDKLKKSSKKKHRSKQPPPTPSTPIPLTPSGYDQPSPAVRSPVSDSQFSLARLDVPSCSIDEEHEEFVAHRINSDYHVEATVAQKNPSVEFSRDCCDYEDDLEEPGGDSRVLNSKNAVWLLVLRGVVVVAVGIYTKSFVLGISIGAFLLCLFEYLGNSALGFFKPCEDVKKKLRGFSPSLGVPKPKRVGDGRNWKKAQDGVLKGAIDIGSKREKTGENGAVSTRGMESKVETTVPGKREIELAVRKDHVSRRGIEHKNVDDDTSKDKVEQGNVTSALNKGNSCKLEEEFRNRTICEIEVFEPNSCESNSTSPVPSEPQGVKGAIERGEGSEGSEMVNHNGKVKKGKKFWGKFVPKQSMKKKNKHRKGKHQASGGPEVPLDCVEGISLESDEGNEQEEKLQMSVREAASSSFLLSSLDERERVVEHIGFSNHSNAEMLHTEEGTVKSSRMMKKKSRNLKCLGILGIALAGLMGGRVFALVLTVICCLIFKIVRG